MLHDIRCGLHSFKGHRLDRLLVDLLLRALDPKIDVFPDKLLMRTKPAPVPVLDRGKLLMVFRAPDATGHHLPFLCVTAMSLPLLGMHFRPLPIFKMPFGLPFRH